MQSGAEVLDALAKRGTALAASAQALAALCGADPTAGLVVSLGFQCVMCVVGIAREPCLGEDFVGASCTNAGRRTAVSSGTPTGT